MLALFFHYVLELADDEGLAESDCPAKSEAEGWYHDFKRRFYPDCIAIDPNTGVIYGVGRTEKEAMRDAREYASDNSVDFPDGLKGIEVFAPGDDDFLLQLINSGREHDFSLLH